MAEADNPASDRPLPETTVPAHCLVDVLSKWWITKLLPGRAIPTRTERFGEIWRVWLRQPDIVLRLMRPRESIDGRHKPVQVEERT